LDWGFEARYLSLDPPPQSNHRHLRPASKVARNLLLAMSVDAKNWEWLLHYLIPLISILEE
jgi:hypothetical protein